MSDELTELAFKLRELKDEKEQLEFRLKEVNKDIKVVAEERLPKILEDREQELVRIPGVGTISLKRDIHVSIKEGAKDEAYEWLAENGHGDLIKEYVHPATLKAWAKEQLEGNMPIPESITTYKQVTAALRRS